MYGGTDYYTRLGLDHFATRGEIKQAYRRLAKKHHPDLNPNDPTAEEQFQQINEAYETLYDSSKRMKYDSGFEDAFRTAYGFNTASASYSQTQSGYGYSDFGTERQGTSVIYEDLSFLEKIERHSKFLLSTFENLPQLHFVVLAGLALLLIIIPIDTSISLSNYTGISMRLMFFVVHMLFSSYWVERSCHNLSKDFVMLPIMVMFTHGAASIISLILTFMLQGLVALIVHLPSYISNAWKAV